MIQPEFSETEDAPTTLAVVPDEESVSEGSADEVEKAKEELQFQGLDVDTTLVKLSGSTNLDLGGRKLKLDDILRVQAEVRVTSVNHVIQEKTGLVQRQYVLKVIEGEIVPFDDGSDGHLAAE